MTLTQHTRVVESAGCPLAYSVRGSGPALLLVQGVGVHGDGWRPQVDAFSGQYTCISFDNRGMGRSRPAGAKISIELMALDALAILDDAGIREAHVAGHSLGGQVALQLALSQRQRVRSLALLCTFADGRAPARGGHMLWLGLRSRLGSARMRRRAFLQIILPPGDRQGRDLDVLAEHLAPLFGHDLAAQPSIAMAQIGAFRRCNLEPRLGELAGIPTLVVSAAHDLIAPPELGQAIAAGIPGARYAGLADAAHGAPITDAASVNALLREHLAAIERRV